MCKSLSQATDAVENICSPSTETESFRQSDRDVTEVVPLDIIKGDIDFFQFMINSNERYRHRFLTLFCLSLSLALSMHSFMLRFVYWTLIPCLAAIVQYRSKRWVRSTLTSEIRESHILPLVCFRAFISNSLLICFCACVWVCMSVTDKAVCLSRTQFEGRQADIRKECLKTVGGESKNYSHELHSGLRFSLVLCGADWKISKNIVLRRYL